MLFGHVALKIGNRVRRRLFTHANKIAIYATPSELDFAQIDRAVLLVLRCSRVGLGMVR